MPPAVATVGRSFRPWTIIAQSGAIQNDFGHCGIRANGRTKPKSPVRDGFGTEWRRAADQRLPQNRVPFVQAEEFRNVLPAMFAERHQKRQYNDVSFRGQVPPFVQARFFIQEKGGRLVRQSRRENFGGNAIGGAKRFPAFGRSVTNDDDIKLFGR